MKVVVFNRLKKFMMMTMSGADQEVLTAIRMANALLMTEGVDWDRVLNRMITLEIEEAPPEHRRDRPETERIDEAFREIEASDPRGSFADFIASLKEQWDRRHSLSDKQKAALYDAASKTRSHR